MPKTHDRDFFYKYTTFNTAKIILENLTVRYSSPLLFNDPFDMQMDLRSPFDEFEDPWVLIDEELLNRAHQDPEPEGKPDKPVFQLIKHLRSANIVEIPRTGRVEDVGGVHESFNQMMNELRSKWNYFLPKMRVFCVSEIYDDLLMWAHYAGAHEGVVIKFKCLSELDNTLCIAQPVSYSETIPPLTTIKDMVDRACGLGSFDTQAYFYKRAFIKSNHWGYEKEWRIVDFSLESQDELFTDHSIHREEIDTIYLGCRMDEPNRQTMWRLIYRFFPHIKIFQASARKEKFQLTFEQVR